MRPPVLFQHAIDASVSFASTEGSSWQHTCNKDMLRLKCGDFVAGWTARVAKVTCQQLNGRLANEKHQSTTARPGVKIGTMSPQTASLSFTGPAARLQYRLLMALYWLAVNRYLFGYFNRFLALVFAPGNAVFLSRPNSAPFKIYLNDTYWTRFALFHRDYEPEVQKVIAAAIGHTPLFCDLGANKGYWSAYAAPRFPNVISVEASAETFARLHENVVDLDQVDARKAAIYSVSGHTLCFVNTYQSHASARLSTDGLSDDRDVTETVTTVKIDDLVPKGTAALIKLDVEGAEIAAISGARRALNDGSVLIYEDHGGDTGCAPSMHLLEIAEIGVYSIENGAIRIPDVAAVKAMKTDRYKGYNFLAARTDSPLLAAILEGFAKD